MRYLLTVAVALLSACSNPAPTPEDHCADLCDAAPMLAADIDCESECTAFVYDEWAGGVDRCPTEAAWAWAEGDYANTFGYGYCDPVTDAHLMCHPMAYEMYTVRERFACAGEG